MYAVLVEQFIASHKLAPNNARCAPLGAASSTGLRRAGKPFTLSGRIDSPIPIPLSRLHAAQSQHERQRMRRRGLKPVVFVEPFGLLVECMHEQGSHPRILRNGHCAIDSVLQQ